jgi:hypothetical protein
MGFLGQRILVPFLMGLIWLALRPRQRVVAVVEQLVLVGNFKHLASKFYHLVLILELLTS